AVKDAVEALNIPVLEIDGVEADDVVGTLARRGATNGFDVIIYTGDKDFLQLIDRNISRLSPGRANKPDTLWTIENADKKFGIRPDQLVDLLALMGDSSDNIPGVRGIGEKTAVKLLQRFGSLDNIYANLDKIKGSLKTKLEQGKESAYLSKNLATIRTDLNIPIDWEQAKLGEPNPDKLLPILEKYELASLIKKLLPEHRSTQEHSEQYKLVKSLDELSEIVRKIAGSQKFCIDTETTSEDSMRAELVGISLSDDVKKGYYIPLAHRQSGGLFEHPENLPLADVRKILNPLLSGDAVKIGQNIKYDMKVLKRAGFDISGKIFDTMVAAYLLDPSSHQHGLDFLAIKYLGYQMTSFSDVAGKGKKQITFDQVEPQTAAKYSCEDVDITMRLAKIFEPKLREMKLDDLFENVEMPLIRVLAEMEMTGIRLDTERLDEIGELARNEMENMRRKIYEIAGEEFNIDSPKQLSHILFEKLAIPPKRKTKTGYSTDAEVMEQLANDGYEIADYIVKYREMSKLLSTYIDALPKMINPHTKRIHTTFNQTVAATGRLSSSSPNLQNIPARGELGSQIRECFVPRDGWLMLSADYSQVELRLMAHFSQDPNLLKAFEQGLDIHSYTASLITGLPLDSINPQLRRMAKTVNFGIMYGLGPHGLSQQLKITHEEAAAFIDNYFQRYPKVKDYVERTIELAEKNGYVETIMGRRRYFPEINSDSHQVKEAAKRAAINTPLQGSAADIIKVAMININRRFHSENFSAKMLLQVHDELVFEFPPDERDRLIDMVKYEMENVVQLCVPLVVDVGVGKNWAEAHS
ncbi:DNA polymerase I, partial [bacterium]